MFGVTFLNELTFRVVDFFIITKQVQSNNHKRENHKREKREIHHSQFHQTMQA